MAPMIATTLKATTAITTPGGVRGGSAWGAGVTRAPYSLEGSR